MQGLPRSVKLREERKDSCASRLEVNECIGCPVFVHRHFLPEEPGSRSPRLA